MAFLGLPVSARVSGPSGSTQSEYARDQLLAEQLIIELLAIASADLVESAGSHAAPHARNPICVP